jgi:2,4-dienoyl-CoA reductase-like NADH-dependent reductase (Old Yellow Enzyme family)
MSALFSSIKLRDTVLPNRIIVSPMCQYSAEHGNACSWHEIHLGTLALSGAAVLFTEATAISAEGRITPGDLGIYSDDNIAALDKMLRGLRHNSHMLLGMQLAHAGRKGSSQAPWEGGALIAPEDGGWTPLAPSAAR